MASFTINFMKNLEPGFQNPQLTPQLTQYQVDYWPPHANLIDPRISGIFNSDLPVSQTPVPFSGDVRKDFYFDYYMQFRLIPTTIDLGNIASEQKRFFYAFNAYLTDVTVEKVEILNGAGLVVTAPVGFETPPFDMKGLKLLQYQLTAGLSGSPNIDATIRFTTSVGITEIRVVGTRLVVFPFPPDWQFGVQETLTARSVLVRSANGTEQSVSYRRRFRRSFNIPYTLKGVARQLFDNLMFAWQSRMFGLPIWPEMSKLTSPVTTGDVVVRADTSYRTIVPDGLVMLVHPRDYAVYETRQVVSKTIDTITVLSGFGQNWPVGTLVIPMAVALAAPQANGTIHTDRIAQMAIQFDCEPSQTDPNTPSVAAATLYDGYELTENTHNWRDATTFTYNSDAQRLDTQTGIFETKTQTPFSGLGRGLSIMMRNNKEASDFRSWLLRRQGKTFATWMSSGFSDFTCDANISEIDTSIPMKRNGYAAVIGSSDARDRLLFSFRNGKKYIRKIVSAVDTEDGKTSIQIDSTLGFAFKPSDVLMISFLNFYRMTDDQVTLDWKLPGVAESNIALVPTRKLSNG